jgi:hypothetical protein
VNTEDPPLRRVRQLRGYGALVVAAVLAVCWVWAPLPAPAWVIEVVAVGVIILFGGVQLWQARKTPATIRVASRYSDPNRLPLPQRVRYFRAQLLLSSLIFPVISAWMAYDLNRLDAGVVTTTRVWLPVAFMYARLGYWPAVLAVPILGGTIWLFWVFKLKQLDRANNSGV